MHVGERIRLTIDRLSTGGEGIARADGMVVFVPYAAPGDTLETEIVQTQKRFARARVLKLLEPSHDRVEPPCPYYYDCGGCTWQHLDYRAQLKAKQQLVQETLERLGGLKDFTVNPVLGMEDPWRYRNKVQQPVGWDGRHIISGFYREGSHEIIPIEDCLVQPELSVRIINRILDLFKEHRIHPYDPERHQGWIRHLLVRTSRAGQAMLVFVSREAGFPKEKQIVGTLRREFPELVAIHHNVQGARSNVILGREWRRIAGQGYLEEQLGDLKFRLSPGAFFQVNSEQAETLYNTVKRMAGKGERLLDLYTGVGTIALWLAKNFKEVGGIEEFPEAVRDADVNASLNQIKNARFMARSAEAFLGGLSGDRRALTLVVDPPRAGLTPSVIKSLLAVRPSTFIYVSCDPATLARDLGLLTQGGFRIEEIQPVDMFPHTPHIETAVKLKG